MKLFIAGVSLTTISALLGLTGPIAVKKIVQYLLMPERDNHLYSYLIIVALIAFVNIFINQYAERKFILASIKSEQLLSMLHYDKILRLPITYRLNMKRGSLFAMWKTDVKAVSSFILTASGLFAGPAGLIGIIIVVFYEFHFTGLAFALCVLLGLIIQLTIAYFMYEYHWKKAEIQSLRTGCNMEMLTEMKNIKLLGW